ncbi:MAG: ATP-binding cassette domain-containing protein [Microthrixaceae bacterium]|nr:ATP-binding cassette domain-containing protein [Microthrixaceae bacterium]
MTPHTPAAGLEIERLTVTRGALTICREIDLTVPLGEITVLLGANGAGKSTLLDGIVGLAPIAEGEIRLGGRRIAAMPVYRRARAGLAYVEQGRSVFSGLTVAQNIAVVDPSRAALEAAFALFPQLAAKREVRAGRLSGGEQQMLVIARALASKPTILLVDELSLGLAPTVVRGLLDVLAELARQGMGVLLVEQFAEAALGVATTAHIMQGGRIVRAAASTTLRHDHASVLSPYFLAGASGERD